MWMRADHDSIVVVAPSTIVIQTIDQVVGQVVGLVVGCRWREVSTEL